MIRRRGISGLVGALLWLSLVPVTMAANAPRDSATTVLPPLLVSGATADLPGPAETRLGVPALMSQDPGSLADVGGLIPGTRVAVNSRGESHLMIRGAPERHVQTFLDGIPLNLPWDERVDLQTIPITGTARISATRGLTTLLDGPGVLAGRVNLLPPCYDPLGRHTRISVMAGDFVKGRTQLQHHNRFGAWEMLGTLGWQGRDALNLPRGVVETGNANHRLNSDLSQYSGLLRASRPVAGTGRLNLLGTYWSAAKGAPAELHLGDEARFWRYPVQQRTLLGAALDLPLNRQGTWDLATALSADFFNQEIDPRGPDNWDTNQITGQDYEKNWDRTGYAKVRATHWLGATTQLSLQTTARYTHHREILTVGGTTEAYSQWLTSVVAAAEFHPADSWQLRLGAGLDHHATPESGPQTANAANTHPAWNAQLTRPLSSQDAMYLAVSQRSRAPSLRELYSGALGRFVPNPELKPERQNLYEAGYSRRTSRWHLETAAFVLYLSDGIEKMSLDNPARQFQRVNRTEIRVPGLELAGGWFWADNLELTLEHTVLAARVKNGGEFSAPAEDRADYLSRAGLNWHPTTGPAALLEAVVTGGRWSADSTAPTGLRRLPPGVVWNARVSYRLVRATQDIELHVRLDNVFDQRVDDQVGLPNAGQTFSAGVTVSF